MILSAHTVYSCAILRASENEQQ